MLLTYSVSRIKYVRYEIEPYLEVTEPTEILTRPTGFLGFFRELGAVEVDWPPLSLCTNKVIFSVV